MASPESIMCLRIYRKLQKQLVLFCQLVLLYALPGYASAEIIDDIYLKTDANGEVDAVIKFSVPIQYSRYFPLRKSADLSIYFNVLGSVARDEWQNYESHRSPASEVVRGFTVTTRDLSTGPKIEVQFSRPVEFTVSAGKNDQSILIHIKPGVIQQKNDDKTMGATASAVPGIGPAVPAVMAPAAQAATAAPAVPAKPAPILPSAPAQAVPAQLGGADGLPLFPTIEKASPENVSSPSAGPLSVAEQSRKADSQAAELMAKGRDAVLTGAMFTAIDAFNNVLKLPPNKYSAAAQVWIGIAREKSGQLAKAKLEYDLYLKLYPDGKDAAWVRGRLAKLNSIQYAVPPAMPQAVAAPQASEFHTAEYGSLSMYYYHGASQTDTVATVGGIQTPSTLSLTDQSALITNVSMTARSYNNEYDNRLVFQDFNAKSFLPGQGNQNRLNAAYYDFKSRVDNYSARIGRQSAMGGGVLGRFDGIAASYGFMQNWRVNIATGQLSDITLDSKPTFLSLGVDFGVNSALGGSAYMINQKAGGITDRKAAGGYLRYFEQGKTAMAMLDYDMQFKALNIFTLQGTLNYDSGTDYNYLLDRRRSPVLDIRNAINGTTSTVSTLLQNGWTTNDLVTLANARTAVSNLAMIGVTQRFREKWQAGTDVIVSNTSGLPASGTLNPDGTTGLEGFVAATPSTGNTWTINGRLSGSDIITQRDMTMGTLSYTRSPFLSGKSLLLYNHSYPRELWTFDSTLRLYWQTDNTGGRINTTSPVFKLGYRLRNSLTMEGEGGIDWTRTNPTISPPSKTTRKYFSIGLRWDI